MGPGLCSDCRHARRIETNRGSIFMLCQLSHADPEFARRLNGETMEMLAIRSDPEKILFTDSLKFCFARECALLDRLYLRLFFHFKQEH